MDLVVYSFFVVKEYVLSVELEFSVWMIDQNSLIGEVWVLSLSRDEYEEIPREFIVDAEVECFSMFRDVDKKLSLMSPARDRRLRAHLLRVLSRIREEKSTEARMLQVNCI